MLNIAQMLDESAVRHGENIAISFGDLNINYKNFNAQANQVANALTEYGIKPGDKVALSCPNLPFFPIICYGIAKAGAVLVPLNILLKGDEVAYHLDDSQARLYFCFEGTADLPLLQAGAAGFAKAKKCEQLVYIPAGKDEPQVDGVSYQSFVKDKKGEYQTQPRHETDTAVLLYTSGTTGRPKGADISHSNLMWNVRMVSDLFELQSNDRQLIVLPLFHTFGQTTQMHASVLCGARSYLMARFEPEAALDLMAKEGITHFAGVPTMYWALLNAEPNEKRIETIKQHTRMLISGGASNPVEIIEQVKKRFGLWVYEGYGLSECSPVVTFNHPGQEPRVGSVGTPIWGVQVRIVDPEGNTVPDGERGELVVRGHGVMSGGYHNKPKETAEAIKNGWFHTGDIAIRQEDGYFYIVDRAKELIIRGGFNVYPREVEEKMLTHEAVSLVAVIGVPDPKYGEEVKAVVVLAEGKQIDEAALIEWCKNEMGGHKYPRQIEFRDSLPTNATGKILKRELKEAS